MIQKRALKFYYLTCLLIIIVTNLNPIKSGNGNLGENEPVDALIEDRILEIHMIGLSDNEVDSTYLLSRLNLEIISEFPFGQTLSKMNIIPKIVHISESKRNSLTENVFLQSNQDNSSTFYIPYTNFSNIISDEFRSETINLNIIKLLIINFGFEGSLFESSDVYINYTKEDIDTQSFSQIMEFSNEGISFELNNIPILGIIPSSNPRFEIDDFPSIQYLYDDLITTYEWNKRLADVIEKILWCRLNPSPIFRYNAHEKVVIHVAMVAMDGKYSLYEILNYVNFTLIQDRLETLLGITTVQIITTVTTANTFMQDLVKNESKNYLQWSNSLATYLKNNNPSFWDVDYKIKDTGFTDELNLFVSIIVGEKVLLPYSDEYGGLSHYSTPSSEMGGLSVVTMNYENLFIKNEGLTRTTLHELGHLFGLIHPHDYWQPVEEMLKYSWEWGYTSSPMTYLISGYDWDYFDYMSLWRIQAFSFINSMQNFDYEEKRVDEQLEKIRSGLISSIGEHLEELKDIYSDYKDREDYHYFFEGTLMPGIILGFCTLMVVIIISYRKTKKMKQFRI